MSDKYMKLIVNNKPMGIVKATKCSLFGIYRAKWANKLIIYDAWEEGVGYPNRLEPLPYELLNIKVIKS